MRYPENLSIAITLDRAAAPSLHEQIATQVVTAVGRGTLVPGTRMPSTRTLAALLDVSRGVAAAAYAELLARGCLNVQRGSGTYVAARHPRSAVPRRPSTTSGAPRPPVDLRPGQASAEAFPVAAWRAAWRRASFRPPPAHAPPPLGLPELRRAVGEHLLRTRGLAVDEHRIVITAGTPYGLRLVLAAAGHSGPAVAVEEPGPLIRPGGPDGATPLPVDAEGIRPDLIPEYCRAVVVSPDVHLPSGRVLSAGRRRELAAWSARRDALVVEVACDAVFRPRASGLPRLTDLVDSGSAALVGGFCEVLTPGLNLGYAVVPDQLTDELGRRIVDRAGQPSHLAQVAVADLLTDGTVVRVMHRLGQLYAHKRRLVEAALRPLYGRIRLSGLDAVNSAVLGLPDRCDAEEVAGALAARGVLTSTLDTYYVAGRRCPPALVIGYGHLADNALCRALAVLVPVLRQWTDDQSGPRPAARATRAGGRSLS
jgi:GntR family transcriptional regulator/MocR family aminotransferase